MSETGAFITLEEANALLAAYKTSLSGNFTPTNPKFFAIDRAQLETLLAKNEESTELRIYLGHTEQNDLQLVLVNVNTDTTNDVSLILDRARRCPTLCANGGDYPNGLEE